MGTIFTLPWVFTVVAAIWLGALAWKSGRSWIGWAIGAAIATVALTTIVFGLAHAASIPFSDYDRAAFRARTALVLAVLLLIVAGAITWGMLKGPPKIVSGPPQKTNP